MGSNFIIEKALKGGDLLIDVRGDFDGSSAMQLLVCLNNCGSNVNRIFINTSGLNRIYYFGKLVFQNNLPSRTGAAPKISFTGKNRGQFI